MILLTIIDMLDMQHADRFTDTDRCPGNFGFVRAKRNFLSKVHLVIVTGLMKDLLG